MTNPATLLGGFMVDYGLGELTNRSIALARHPQVNAFLLRGMAQASGYAAGKAEYAARSLRRMESSLTERADRIERGPAFLAGAHPPPPPTLSLAELIRSCWKE